MISLAFDKAFGAEIHMAVKDGGERPIETCPECREETYVVAEARCAVCDFEVPEDATCAICAAPLDAEEYSEHGDMCSYHAHVFSKDD
jgi:hypothetical protein